MAYQRRTRTPRDFSRRGEKSRTRSKSERHRETGNQQLVERPVPTTEEVVERTLNSLQHLGNQRFAVAPYYEHFDRWLLSLRTILSEFQSSPIMTMDDRFTEDCSQVLSQVEATLNERRLKEASREEAIRTLDRNLLEANGLLAKLEREQATIVKEISAQRERAVKPVLSNLGRVRGELDHIVRMRAGFLRGISKRAKAERTAEATQKLDSTKRELTNIERSFSTEEQKLRDDYKKRRGQILQQIGAYKTEASALQAGSDVNDALHARQLACDVLVNAVNALLQRNKTQSVGVNSSP